MRSWLINEFERVTVFWLLKRLFKYLLYFISGVIVLAAVLVVYLIWLQPPFYFPKPTGQYAVGTTTHHVVADEKELMMQLWYPAQGSVADKPTIPYAPYVINHLKKNQKLYWLLALSHSAYSYAVPEAGLVGDVGKLPVIIFSHGFSLTRNHNTAQCEELASHGYIVVGISHSYGCGVVQFPDGRVAAPDQTEKAKKFLENPMADFEEMNKNIEIWVDDVKTVLDYLEQITADQVSRFYDRLDMKHVGMFGHSYGGAAAAQLCRHDQRIKAGVDMDGHLYGPDWTKGFDKPFMFLLAEPWSKTKLMALMTKSGFAQDKAQEYVEATYQHYHPAFDQLIQSVGHDVYKIILKDSAHMDFCDTALMKEAALLPWLLQNFGAGKLNGFRATEIVNAYLVNFFDKYLKEQPSELLDGGGKGFAEIEVRQ